jgi:hypothetical protein
MQHTLTAHGPFMLLQDTLQQLGLLEMFPYLRQGLSGEKLEQAAQNPGGQGHVVQ